MKKQKHIDIEALRKRTSNAILTVRKSALIAMAQNWLTVEQEDELSHHIAELEKLLLEGIPMVKPPDSSEADITELFEETESSTKKSS